MTNVPEPSTHKHKRHLNPLYGLLLTLTLPVITYLLFPKGDDLAGLFMFFLIGVVASIVYAVDTGVFWWMVLVLEATLWLMFTVSVPSLNHDFSTENLLWLCGRFFMTWGFMVVATLLLGMGYRWIIEFIKQD